MYDLVLAVLGLVFYGALVAIIAGLFGRMCDRAEYHDAVRERLAALRRLETC